MDPEADTAPDTAELQTPAPAPQADAGDTAVPADTPSEDARTKALSYNEIMQAVQAAVFDAADMAGTEELPRSEYFVTSILVYPDYAVVGFGSRYYRAAYTMDGGIIAVAPVAEWTPVEMAWVNQKRVEDLYVALSGEQVKALGNGVVGGYLVRFTDPDNPDLEGDYFDHSTDFGPHTKTAVYYQHGLDKTLGLKRLGARHAAGMADIKVDDVGVWIQHQLDLADEYEEAIYALAQRGKLGWSSGTAGHLVERVPVGGRSHVHHLRTWILGIDASYTPSPAAGPGKTQVIPLKVYKQEQASKAADLQALLQEAKTSADATAVPPAAAAPDVSHSGQSTEELNMDPETLKTLVTGAVEAAVAPIQAQVNDLKTTLEAQPPTNGAGVQLPDAQQPAAGNDAAKAFNLLRFTDPAAAKAQVLKELSGGNFAQFDAAQRIALARYARGGTDALSRDEIRLLKTQVFAPAHVEMMLKEVDVATIKDTMVEAQGALGGFALAPSMQESIITRLPGRTAVRGNGAMVITLVRNNSVMAPLYSGGNDRYVGALRGAWGNETATPTEKNATLGDVEIVAGIYTYKIPMSQSLVEDAANLVALIQDDILTTFALDEDEACLVGDGAGNKPLGILPGGLNALSLTTVNSGGASALTTAGIKKLKRGVASQYRQSAIFIANSDTYGAIEVLTVSGTGSDFAFPDLSDNATLLRRPAAESEAMPDVASNAFPILFVDPSGYWIVERPGMTIVRFQDSNTGINKVEFHVRKREGGRFVKPWCAAVQKVAA